jgi:universal stress protein A
MRTYKNLLAAIDLTEEAPEILDAAHQMALLHGAGLSVITVIRPLTYAYTGMETATMGQAVMNFEVEAQAVAKRRLAELCAPVNVPEERCHIVFGSPAQEIKAHARAMKADLIVVGSHGRRGLGLLLGSTANGVLHGADCDVLTIRIR